MTSIAAPSVSAVTKKGLVRLWVNIFLSLDVVGVPGTPSHSAPAFLPYWALFVPLACCARSSRKGAANPSARP